MIEAWLIGQPGALFYQRTIAAASRSFASESADAPGSMATPTFTRR
jgi:hypothetical protein